MQAKEPFVNYVAEPSVLTINVLQNGVLDIQDDIVANLNKMRAEAAKRGFLSDEEIEAEIRATREDISPTEFLNNHIRNLDIEEVTDENT